MALNCSPQSPGGVNSQWWKDFEEVDPVDLLPNDPFGMNSTLTATLAKLTFMSEMNQALMLSWEPLIGGYGPIVFQRAFGFEGLPAGGGAAHSPVLHPRASCSPSSGFGEDPSISGDAALVFREDPSTSGDAARGFREDPSTSGNAALACCGTVDAVPVQEGSVPHDGIMFALGYLGLRDTLSVEMVCKSLHSAVRNDPLLWRCIHVEPALCEKISDADLLRLTQKCPGALQCLNIEGCINITDQGLKAVFESNPRLTKLSIDGCARLTLDGLISSLKSFNMKAVVGIKNLRIGKQFNLPRTHYEELVSLLKIDRMQALHNREPRFHHADRLLTDCSDGYALDIEMCPICEDYKLVFDCPDEGCNDRRSGNCRACDVCIKRCHRCGRCVEDKIEFHEGFDLFYHCDNCGEDPVSSLADEKEFAPIVSIGRIASPC